MKRILVTGSRAWVDEGRLGFALGYQVGLLMAHGSKVVVVHGHCPRGADRMADNLCKQYGIQTERHPADWNQHGPKAGFIRNADMVRLGADVCLAFIKGGSRGATHTADLAESAGIKTVRFIA